MTIATRKVFPAAAAPRRPGLAIAAALRDFSLNGRKTLVERRDGVDFYFNEF